MADTFIVAMLAAKASAVAAQAIMITERACFIAGSAHAVIIAVVWAFYRAHRYLADAVADFLALARLGAKACAVFVASILAPFRAFVA